MTRRIWLVIAALAVATACLIFAVLPTHALPTAPSEDQMLAQGKFQFTVVESFDGKYLGDTPGHLGRGGKLEGRRPNVAIGDRVFREQQTVGRVTRAEWDRARGSLDIEFGPDPLVRVATGDVVWIWLDGSRTDGE